MIRQYGRCAWLALSITAVPLICPAQAAPDSAQLGTITVLGTRTQKTTDAVPRSIDVIGRDRITREQSADPGEIVDALPNVDVTGSPRPLGESIQIRGLSGDRILLLIDGVRQDFFTGHLGAGFISPALIESIEVQRGPASVLWGSGALGGVVSIDTKETADLLADDDNIGASLRGGYQSASDAWITGGSVYGRLGDGIDALVDIGRRSNENLELGDGSTLPQSAYQRTSALLKSTWHVSPGHSLQFSHRRLRLDGNTPSNPASTVSRENPLLDREIKIDTSRIEWQLVPMSRLVDLKAGLSHTRTEVDENERSAARHDRTEVDGWQVDLANTSRFDLGLAGKHALTYGVDANHQDIEARRDGRPRQSIPNAKRLIWGAFVQDEIRWNQAWSTLLGLRYDHYRSEPDAEVAPDQNDSAWSAQAGLLWQVADWLQLYASYAEAFRAPSLTELYATGTHFGANQFVPNPDLKPEQAANKEIGLRTRWAGLFAARDLLQFQVTAFRNDVDDFIDTIVTVVPLPGPPFVGGTTRSANVTEARLEGFEAVASYTADAWFLGLSYGQTRGDNETEDQPLADIAADTWVARAGVTALPWDGRIIWRVTRAEAQRRVPPGTQATGSYTVHDLLTTWHPTQDVRLDVGVGNIADRAYRRHNAVIDEAGRNIKLGLTLTF